MKGKMIRIQMLRGVLFVLILLFHCNVPYSNFFWAGIEAFFVLSAFFLTRKFYQAERFSVITQIGHRIKRLYSPYLCVLVVAIAFALAKKLVPWDLLSHLLSAQTFHWMVTGYSSALQPITAHTWTLSIDVWLGLLWLFMLKFLPKKKFKYCMYLLLFLSICLRSALILSSCSRMIITLSPASHLDAFVLGSLLAIYVDEPKKKADKWAACVGVVGAVGLVASLVVLMTINSEDLVTAYKMLNASEQYLGNIVSGQIFLYIAAVFCWLIYWLYLKDSALKVRGIGIVGPIVYLGDRSYVLYLFHWPIVTVLRHFYSNWLFLLIVGGIATIIAAFVFERWGDPLLRKIGGKRVDPVI